MDEKTEAHGEICETDPCTVCDAISGGLAATAQALINISEGLTNIEEGSPLFNGMNRLMTPDVAALIRAAPWMLEVLKGVLYFGTTPATMRAVRRAIAKAEGR